MRTVTVRPLTEAERKISPLYRPRHPPIFPQGNPTPAERELARELFKLLDAESRRWYGTASVFTGLD